MLRRMTTLAAALATAVQAPAFAAPSLSKGPNYNDIQTVVVIYAENRSFDNLYGTFPGANGLARASRKSIVQLDRDGKPLPGLPPVWHGIAGGVMTGAPTAPVTLTEGETKMFLDRFDHPYNVAALYKSGSTQDADPLAYTNHDLWHRFYENQMQINHGANNMFAAWADSGGMTMGYFTPTAARSLPLWRWAHEYVLADNFFQAGFGGSFFNHFELICACAPFYGHDGINPNGGNNPSVQAVEPDGVTLSPPPGGYGSAMDSPPKFKHQGNLTPDFYAVNTMQPPYPPSANAAAGVAPQQNVNLQSATTLLPQTDTTIGDLLSKKHIDWAYYSGAWDFALNHAPGTPGISKANPNFQYHHQPFNYFAAFDPATPEGQANRAAHLRDAGVAETADKLPDSRFLTDIQTGKLPPVTFYKPQGTFNEHAGYASVIDGDRHIAAVLAALKASPQWKYMLVVVTYDEFGGWWDHVAPPKADRFGPGTRIPALVVSPYARKGTVDHTEYDTTSILRFITHRWSLPVLPGIATRDAALAANHQPRLGDLTQALRLP